MRRAFLGVFFALASACSSDAATEPEPLVDTPGSFVAFEQAPGEIRVIRILGGLQLDNGTILFVTTYAPVLSSFDAAQELAKDRSAPIALLSTSLGRKELVSHPYRVVWFRTLSNEEKELLP